MAPARDDDLFKDTTMTFGEHLDELRVCLVKAVAGLLICSIIGLLFASQVVDVLTSPMTSALKTFYKTKAAKDYEAWSAERIEKGQSIPYSVEEVNDIAKGDAALGLPELIYEVRYLHPATLDPATAPPPPVKEPQTDATTPAASDDATKPSEPTARYTRQMLVPVLFWQKIDDDERVNMTGLSATEAFMIWFKAGLVFGAVMSSPWVFFQIWTFVAAGLYSHERSYVYLYLPFSLGLFLLGASTAYLFVFQPVLDFLLEFNRTLNIDPDPRISEWLSFVLLMPLGFGVSFQLPLVMLFLERLGIFSQQAYIEKWRIAVLVIFIVSAILTPADPYSIFLMAVPLTFLYFGGVLMCRWMPGGKKSPIAG